MSDRPSLETRLPIKNQPNLSHVHVRLTDFEKAKAEQEALVSEAAAAGVKLTLGAERGGGGVLQQHRQQQQQQQQHRRLHRRFAVRRSNNSSCYSFRSSAAAGGGGGSSEEAEAAAAAASETSRRGVERGLGQWRSSSLYSCGGGGGGRRDKGAAPGTCVFLDARMKVSQI